MLEIPNYRIEKELGSGGMSTVYLATHTILDRQVALKIMSPSYLNNDAFKECFINEGKIISKLDNPHIIHIYDIGISNDACYMAIELLETDTLHQKIEKKLLSFENIERIIFQIASALTTAHYQNFIHRDIKPKNILFRKNGDAVLTDFGISKVQNTEGDLTTLGYISGTPAYMPPEYSMGEELDHRGDIYSLGVVFYEMLTGEKPYQGKTPAAVSYKHANEPIPRLESKFAHYQAVLDRSLAKKPQDRFDSATAFALAVKMADPNLTDTVIAPRGFREKDTSETVILQNPSRLLNKEKSSSKKGIFLGLGLIALLATGVFSYLKLYNPTQSFEKPAAIVKITPNDKLLKISSTVKSIDAEISNPVEFVKTEKETLPLSNITHLENTETLKANSLNVIDRPNDSSTKSSALSSKLSDSSESTIESLKPVLVAINKNKNETKQIIETNVTKVLNQTSPSAIPKNVLVSKEINTQLAAIEPVKKPEKFITTPKATVKNKSKTINKEKITIIISLLDNCMVRASTAIKEHIRIKKNKNIIKEIKGLKMDSGRTKFITSTQQQIQLSEEKFNSNISHYYKNLTKLKHYRVKNLQKQLTIIRNNPLTRQVNQEITRIILRHIKLLGKGKLTVKKCKKDFSVYANNILNSF